MTDRVTVFPREMVSTMVTSARRPDGAIQKNRIQYESGEFYRIVRYPSETQSETSFFATRLAQTELWFGRPPPRAIDLGFVFSPV